MSRAMASTAELTELYLSEHRSIRDCLLNGLINYSALSRKIADELHITNTTSMEAILVAARRYKEKHQNKTQEKAVIELLKQSNVSVKNNVVIVVIEKNGYPEGLLDIERQIKKERGLFYMVEGVRTITALVQKNNLKLLQKTLTHQISEVKEDNSLISIDNTKFTGVPGVIYFTTGLLYERDINMDVYIGVYGETLLVIASKDLPKVIKCFGV